MAKSRTIYAARRPLRALERVWTALERLVNRLAPPAGRLRPHNPLYHLGPLAIFLLIFLTITGVYLTLLYRPGSDRAYASVAAISSAWLGSLMRTSHRYAADALILVTLLHALKALLSDRFWGSRWLAWVSGWGLVALFWLVGTMGYFLVWDEAAQWLTEYAIHLFEGSLALSFLGPDAASRTFSFFVIVLFLHIFVPILLIVGILVHVLRLTRVRYWAPRWLMIGAVAVLILLSLWRPALSGQSADLGRLVATVQIDWWYMGFLPLASHLSGPWFWGLSLLLLAVAAILPWAGRGQHLGPAMVISANCTGCALCARECPYEAIDMVHREDETSYSSIALVKPDLCTGCGVCVGACADSAIELAGLHSAVMRQDLRRTLLRANAADRAPVVIFTCDRHEALGTLPPLADSRPVETFDLRAGGGVSLLPSKLPPRVNVGAWPDDQGRPQPVLTCVLPCMGMLHPNWAAETIEAGAAGAIMVTCPADDCAFREGPHWVDNRVRRRRTLRRGDTHHLELAPGSRQELLRLWSLMNGAEGQAAQARRSSSVVGQTPQPPAGRPARPALAGSLAVGLAILAVIFAASILLHHPATVVAPEAGRLRLVINHSGQLVADASELPPDVAAKLPPGVDAAQVLGGERFAVQLRLMVDGEEVLTSAYRPAGLRREGSIYGLATWWLPPGRHQVEILLMDDGETWRPAFSGVVEVAPGQVRNLHFDDERFLFLLQE